jgi:carbon starvation protein
MSALGIVAFAFACYLLGYLLYSRYLAKRVFVLDDSRRTPAHELRDGVDYVPTNKWILLGHHFTSITGAGPIVGPAIAVIWGWVPALLWVVLGAVFIGAVHDLGALVTSMRHKGRSIGTILGEYAGERARVLFLLLILALAILVNAVFAYVIALLFTRYPSSVIPAWTIVPLAVAFGYSVYRFRVNFLIPTGLFLILLYLSMLVGSAYPVDVKPLADALGLEPIMFWIVVLFTYTFFASALPVWVLLQPRDFLNGLQVLILLFLIYLGAMVSNPKVVAPALNLSPEGAPPIFPFLFITIACGALSGFHALVSSGTSSKQIARESDARTVGYLGFLGESSLATAVIVACTAGIAMASATRFEELYGSWASIKKSAVPAVVEGGANLIASLGIDPDLSRTLVATLVVLFAATTMDTSVRIQRYILNELGVLYRMEPLRNKWTASLIAVGTSMGLVLAKEGGKGGLLFWPVFGAANQLLAGLALLVTYLYLRREGRPSLPVVLPLLLVLVITSTAMFLNTVGNFQRGDYLLATVSGVILVLEVAIILEALRAIRSEGKG